MSEADPRSRQVFWGYQDLALFIGAWLPCLFLSAILVGVFRGTFRGAPAGRALDALLIQFLAYAFLFLCLYLLLRVRYGRPFWASLAWDGSRRGIVAALFIGPVLALTVAVLGLLLDPPQIENPFRELLSDRFSIVLIGAFAITLGPLCEELAFRGFLQPLLSRTVGVAAGIVLANVPFALMHGPQYGWSWQHVVLVAVAGTAFGAVRHYTGSTGAAAGMHATYNLTFFSGFVLQRGNQFGQW
jgi:hypothetical protein